MKQQHKTSQGERPLTQAKSVHSEFQMALNGIHAKLNTDESIKEDHDMEMSRIMKCIHMLTEEHTHTQSRFKVQIMHGQSKRWGIGQKIQKLLR